MTITTSKKNFSWNHTFSIGIIMPFPLGLYSIGVKSHGFSIGTKFKHWTYFKFLSIVFRITYAIFGSNHSRMLFEIRVLSNQTHWIKIQMHYNDREDQHCHLSDVKLLHWWQHCDAYDYVITYIKNILSQLLLRFAKMILMLLTYKLK